MGDGLMYSDIREEAQHGLRGELVASLLESQILYCISTSFGRSLSLCA